MDLVDLITPYKLTNYFLTLSFFYTYICALLVYHGDDYTGIHGFVLKHISIICIELICSRKK